MLRFVPLTLILLAVAGCGSSAANPGGSSPTHTGTKTNPNVPASGVVLFGTSQTGNRINGHPTNQYAKPSTVAWVGHLSSAPGSKPLNVVIHQLSPQIGGSQQTVWHWTVTPTGSLYVPGQLTAAQITSRGLKTNNSYSLEYVVGSSTAAKILATGYFSLGKPTGSSPPGY